MFHPFQLFVVLNRLRHSLKSSRTLQCYLTRTFSFSTTQGILWLFRTLSQLIFRKQEWCKKFSPLLCFVNMYWHVTGMTNKFFKQHIRKKNNSAVKLTVTFFCGGEVPLWGKLVTAIRHIFQWIVQFLPGFHRWSCLFCLSAMATPDYTVNFFFFFIFGKEEKKNNLFILTFRFLRSVLQGKIQVTGGGTQKTYCKYRFCHLAFSTEQQ